MLRIPTKAEALNSNEWHSSNKQSKLDMIKNKSITVKDDSGYCRVYITTHRPTGQYYIGFTTVSVDENRWYRGSGTIIKKLLKEYPLDQFCHVTLEEYNTMTEGLIKELQLIEESIDDPLCLNQTKNCKVGDFSGSKWVNNCKGISKRVLKVDLDRFFEENPEYILGRGQTYTLGSYTWMFHESHGTRRINPDDIEEYMKNGWKVGRKPGLKRRLGYNKSKAGYNLA